MTVISTVEIRQAPDTSGFWTHDTVNKNVNDIDKRVSRYDSQSYLQQVVIKFFVSFLINRWPARNQWQL